MKLPQRTSLVEQVAQLLREDLLSGRWPDHLPGEHQLSDELQVSRSTLRASLATLQTEGLLQGGRGRKRQPAPQLPRLKLASSTIVGVISSLPLHRHSAHSIIIFDELRRHLQQAGLSLRLHVMPQSAKGVGERKLRQIVEQTQAACWVLSSCSIELQEWFARENLRTLVQGSCHHGVSLPFIRCDAAAACRHAVGKLRARGHRRIVMLLPKSPFAGTLEIAEAFRQACAGIPILDTPVRFQSGDPAAIETTVNRLLRSTRPPTALIAMMPSEALATFCLLANAGHRIPGDLSLISLFDDPLLNYVIPRLSRYDYNDYAFARKMARLVLRMVKQGGQAPSISTLPRFIEGGTVGPARP